MATYLKSLPAKASDDAPAMETTVAMRVDLMERGAKVYGERCVGCHQPSGEACRAPIRPSRATPASS